MIRNGSVPWTHLLRGEFVGKALRSLNRRSPVPTVYWVRPMVVSAAERGRLGLYVVIVALAAALRFFALEHGLRHSPHQDEQVFLDSAREMVVKGDFDHRFYEYPGLFLYLLRPLVARYDDDLPAACLAARKLMALFGTASVVLVGLWGRRLVSPRAGLAAALLLAVAPLAVETGHLLRPDVVLQTLALCFFLALSGVGERPSGDLRAGGLIGLCSALKFTGVFLIPVYLLRRLTSPGPRLRGILLAGLMAALVFAATSPYSILHARDFLGGIDSQVSHHYQPRARGAVPYPLMCAQWIRTLARGVGLPAALLAAAGLVVLRREWRTWAPFLLLPATAIAVLATSDYRYERHMMSSLPVVILLAVAVVDRFVGPAAAFAAIAVGIAALPLRASVDYLDDLRRPSTRDVVLDWTTAHVRDGSFVVSSIDGMGLDASRVEVLSVKRLGSREALLTPTADVVLAGPEDDPMATAGLTPVFTAAPETRLAGPPVRVFTVPAASRPVFVPVLATCHKASDNEADVSLACDGREDTVWSTSRPQAPLDWIEARLDEAAVLGRVELVLGDAARYAAKDLKLLVSEDGETFAEAPSVPGRPRPELQHPARGPASQVLLLPPTRARAVRLVLTKRAVRRWAVAEVRLSAVAPRSLPSRSPAGAP